MAEHDDSRSSGPKRHEDVLLVHSKLEESGAWRVLRARDGRVEAGVIRAVEDGKPIHGELVTLTPRAGAPEGLPLFDVEVRYTRQTRGRPAQVATSRYRENWEAIFGARPAESGRPN